MYQMGTIMTSPKMKQILRLFTAPGQELPKADIVKYSGLRYYHNTEKYVGEILGRMVANGLLERVKPGVYRIGIRRAFRKAKAEPVKDDPNQLTLF
jgi:hypothetical protein